MGLASTYQTNSMYSHACCKIYKLCQSDYRGFQTIDALLYYGSILRKYLIIIILNNLKNILFNVTNNVIFVL